MEPDHRMMELNWIVYQDASLVVVNKPAGLPVIPDGYRPDTPCIVRMMENTFGKLWVVHRLDKETSGVLVFARSADAHRHLNTQFQEHSIRKEYTALVSGVPGWETYDVTLPLRINADRRHRTIVDALNGKPARTVLTAQESYPSAAMILVQPHTGYTHQIRAHLAALGFPILNDDLYSTIHTLKKVGSSSEQTDWSFLPSGMYLHARMLQFVHPDTGELQVFSAPPPEKWDIAARLLRGNK
jgi:RluA family pseudouridine synthase